MASFPSWAIGIVAGIGGPILLIAVLLVAVRLLATRLKYAQEWLLYQAEPRPAKEGEGYPFLGSDVEISYTDEDESESGAEEEEEVVDNACLECAVCRNISRSVEEDSPTFNGGGGGNATLAGGNASCACGSDDRNRRKRDIGVARQVKRDVVEGRTVRKRAGDMAEDGGSGGGRGAERGSFGFPLAVPYSRYDCADPSAAQGFQHYELLSVPTRDGITLRGYVVRPAAVSDAARQRAHLVAEAMKKRREHQQTGCHCPRQQPTTPVGSASSIVPRDCCCCSCSEETDSGCGFVPAPDTSDTEKGVIVYFHGNAGNVGHRLPIAYHLAKATGCAVVMIDYRGYGRSDDPPTGFTKYGSEYRKDKTQTSEEMAAQTTTRNPKSKEGPRRRDGEDPQSVQTNKCKCGNSSSSQTKAVAAVHVTTRAENIHHVGPTSAGEEGERERVRRQQSEGGGGISDVIATPSAFERSVGAQIITPTSCTDAATKCAGSEANEMPLPTGGLPLITTTPNPLRHHPEDGDEHSGPANTSEKNEAKEGDATPHATATHHHQMLNCVVTTPLHRSTTASSAVPSRQATLCTFTSAAAEAEELVHEEGEGITIEENEDHHLILFPRDEGKDGEAVQLCTGIVSSSEDAAAASVVEGERRKREGAHLPSFAHLSGHWPRGLRQRYRHPIESVDYAAVYSDDTVRDGGGDRVREAEATEEERVGVVVTPTPKAPTPALDSAAVNPSSAECDGTEATTTTTTTKAAEMSRRTRDLFRHLLFLLQREDEGRQRHARRYEIQERWRREGLLLSQSTGGGGGVPQIPKLPPPAARMEESRARGITAEGLRADAEAIMAFVMNRPLTCIPSHQRVANRTNASPPSLCTSCALLRSRAPYPSSSPHGSQSTRVPSSPPLLVTREEGVCDGNGEADQKGGKHTKTTTQCIACEKRRSSSTQCCCAASSSGFPHAHNKVFVMGSSLGGAAATYAATIAANNLTTHNEKEEGRVGQVPPVPPPRSPPPQQQQRQQQQHLPPSASPAAASTTKANTHPSASSVASNCVAGLILENTFSSIGELLVPSLKNHLRHDPRARGFVQRLAASSLCCCCCCCRPTPEESRRYYHGEDEGRKDEEGKEALGTRRNNKPAESRLEGAGVECKKRRRALPRAPIAIRIIEWLLVAAVRFFCVFVLAVDDWQTGELLERERRKEGQRGAAGGGKGKSAEHPAARPCGHSVVDMDGGDGEGKEEEEILTDMRKEANGNCSTQPPSLPPPPPLSLLFLSSVNDLLIPQQHMADLFERATGATVDLATLNASSPATFPHGQPSPSSASAGDVRRGGEVDGIGSCDADEEEDARDAPRVFTRLPVGNAREEGEIQKCGQLPTHQKGSTSAAEPSHGIINEGARGSGNGHSVPVYQFASFPNATHSPMVMAARGGSRYFGAVASFVDLVFTALAHTR